MAFLLWYSSSLEMENPRKSNGIDELAAWIKPQTPQK